MSKKNDKNIMYGLEEYKNNGLSLGFIAEDSFDHGGSKPEFTPIRAAQVKGYAVLNIPKTTGTIAPTFDLIQFDYPNMCRVLGGRVLTDNDANPVGWSSPTAAVLLRGYHEIFTDSGQVIVVPCGIVSGSISGGLTLTDTSKLNVEIVIEQPADKALDAIYIMDAEEYTPYDAKNPATALAALKAYQGYTLEEWEELQAATNEG
ncbi:MAG: hypothetical protein ACRCUJ_14325 [Phocaeicola sp.]